MLLRKFLIVSTPAVCQFIGEQLIFAAYIPKNCYILREDFKDNQSLYEFMKNIPESDYENYLHNIRQFLSSKEAEFYSIDYFIKTMMNLIQTPPSKEKENIS